MVTIKLYGNLKRFGSEFTLDIKDTAEPMTLKWLVCIRFLIFYQGAVLLRQGRILFIWGR